jgi:Ni/Fe-hydrogenase subunit HybB-like protein
MSSHKDATPIGGPILTTTFKIAAVLAITAGLIILWRFSVGLGPTTGMTDDQPWGIWKLFNVIVLTSVASGGYAIALLVYILNRGRYHSLVRHALLTSAVGYTAAILALGIDVGAPWNFWKVPAWTWAWNTDSVLLEVALCITAYILVLWAEMSPAFLEQWSRERRDRWGRLAGRILPHVDRSLIWIIALGIVLPTMHQSSLGSLYILAGPKVHPYWQTPWLPLFFLLSCWIMGYASVIITYIVSSTRYRRETETETLMSLGRIISWVIVAFVVGRAADLLYRGQLDRILAGDGYNWILLAEFSLLIVPVALLRRMRAGRLGGLYQTALMIILGAALYRIAVVWVGFRPIGGAIYFPTLPELAVALGFIALQIMGYLVIVKKFPILDARTRRAPGAAPAGGESLNRGPAA